MLSSGRSLAGGSIGLDARTRTVRMPAGVELDLGSSGKALASDLRCGRP